jgi:hypothetical protein
MRLMRLAASDATCCDQAREAYAKKEEAIAAADSATDALRETIADEARFFRKKRKFLLIE